MAIYDDHFKKAFLEALDYKFHEIKFLNQRWDDRENEWKSSGTELFTIAYQGEYPEILNEYKDGVVEISSSFRLTCNEELSKYLLENAFKEEYLQRVFSILLNRKYENK